MHELALAEGVLQIVEDTVRMQDCTRVNTVWLEIGELSHVQPEAIQFCFEAVAHNTIADGARLEICCTPGLGWCHACGCEVKMPSLVSPCPLCDGYQLQVTGGEDMRVREMEVD